MDFKKLEQAISLVGEGAVKRLDIEQNVKVYAVGENIIRIDIKK